MRTLYRELMSRTRPVVREAEAAGQQVARGTVQAVGGAQGALEELRERLSGARRLRCTQAEVPDTDDSDGNQRYSMLTKPVSYMRPVFGFGLRPPRDGVHRDDHERIPRRGHSLDQGHQGRLFDPQFSKQFDRRHDSPPTIDVWQASVTFE